MLLCQHEINIKIINETVYSLFFPTKPLESDVSFRVTAQLHLEQSCFKGSIATRGWWHCGGQASPRATIKSAVFRRAVRTRGEAKWKLFCCFEASASLHHL